MSAEPAAPIDRLPAAAQAVLAFWFGPPGSATWEHECVEWFKKDAAFDARILERFGALIDEVLAGSLADWPTPWGRLARIVVLDQFTRNVFRDSPRAFAGDAAALALARELVAAGDDRRLPPTQRSFAYMPFEHAEDMALQDQSVRLFTALVAAHPPAVRLLAYAEKHRAVIARFGRFPHRNAALGRPSTAEELAFIAQPGSRF